MNNPTNHTIDTWIQRGFAQHQIGELRNALSSYKCALAIDPTHPDALCLSGIAEFALGNHVDGLNLAKRANELHPDFVTGYIELAKMLEAVGNIEEALNAYGKAFHTVGFIQSARLPTEVLGELVTMIAKQSSDTWHEACDHFTCYGRLYAQLTSENAPQTTLTSMAKEALAIAAGDAREISFKINTLLDLLCFSINSTVTRNKAILEQLALPWMKEALASQRYDVALELEYRIYNSYVKQTETANHFHESFAQWLEPMRQAGYTAARNLAPVTSPRGEVTPTVGFFLHQASMLAHVEVMLSVLDNLPKGADCPFVPRVYIFNGTDPELLKRLAQAGVSATVLNQQCQSGDNKFERLLCLRAQLAKDRVSALVWISAAVMLPFAFALRLAPVQIWWAMKYHGLESPDIDGYLTSQSLAAYKEIDGQLWRSGRLYIKDGFVPALAPEAARIRQHYSKSSIILGSLGREEKLNSAPFLDSVIAVLRLHPDAAFLWTGRTQLANIQSRLNQAGVAGQCHFIGWVDVKLYAQVLDIFLDSFPFPNGYTVMYAMAAGKPVVFFNSREASETGLPGLVLPVLRGLVGTPEEQSEMRLLLQPEDKSELFLCADSPEEFQTYANNLVRSADLRKCVGNAMQEIVRKYLSDPKASAMSHAHHILEIIAEKSKRIA